jgi:hypothetical protein
LGSGECSYIEGTVDFRGEWHNWLLDMAAIGEGDQLGAGSEINNGGKLNMSAKA